MIPINADSPDVQPCDAISRLLQVLTLIAAIPLWGEDSAVCCTGGGFHGSVRRLRQIAREP